jgi:hypothetical protein
MLNHAIFQNYKYFWLIFMVQIFRTGLIGLFGISYIDFLISQTTDQTFGSGMRLH